MPKHKKIQAANFTAVLDVRKKPKCSRINPPSYCFIFIIKQLKMQEKYS